jgi:hypothetical protein
VGKIAMTIIMTLAITVVFNVEIITDVAIFMLQLSAAELPANWAQWWWWRFNGPARMAASFGGAAIFCIVVLGPKLLAYFGVSGAESLTLPWWWQTMLVMGLTTVLWVIVALLTKPDPDVILSSFYEKARPLGAWKPFSAGYEDSIAKNSFIPIFKGIGIAVIGFAGICLLILGLTEAWFGRYGLSAIELVLSTALFIVFRRTSGAYLNFLSDRVEIKRTNQSK